jgi:hypothetical protein
MSKKLKTLRQSATAESISHYQKRVEQFIDARGGAIRNSERESHLASWDFYLHMCEENQARATAATNNHLRMGEDASVYAELCELMSSTYFNALDLVSRRALEVMKVFFSANQPVAGKDGEDVRLREELEARKTELSRLMNTVSSDELIAGTANGVSKPFAELLLGVVIQRNELARLRGHSDYYRMRMSDEEGDYSQMRRHIDELKVALDVLHEQFQRLPQLEDEADKFSLTKLSGDRKRPESVLVRTGQLLGLSTSSLENILAASDIHPRAKKNGHYFLFPVDAPHDVRAFLNVSKDAEQISATQIQYQMLHEIVGHGVDFASLRVDLPAILRDHKAFSTEVMAMLAQRLPYEVRWLKFVGGLDAKTTKKVQHQLQREEFESTLNSMRYQILIVEFEALMYENPTQDLDALFKKLNVWYHGYEIANDRYAQGYWSLFIPHFVEYPAYYHNYLLGTAWAMQVREAMRRKFGSFASRRVGPYLAKRRCNGLLYTPEEQLVQISGEPFSCNAVIQSMTRLLSSVQKTSQVKEPAACT